MKKKIIIICLIVFVCLWTTFFVTDSIRCKNNKEPIFCVEVARYNDGGSIKYVGLFYNYYSIKQLTVNEVDGNYESEYLVDKVITPWFLALIMRREKLLIKILSTKVDFYLLY